MGMGRALATMRAKAARSAFALISAFFGIIFIFAEKTFVDTEPT